MEFVASATVTTLFNQGVDSEQLLSPENSNSERVTITRVTVQPNASQPRHNHPTSEQIWVALEGKSTLLLEDDKTHSFHAGDVVRFSDGDIHGLHNTSSHEFKYMSITTPPINFSSAYSGSKQKG